MGSTSLHRRLGDRHIKVLALDLAGRSGYAILFGHGIVKIGTMKLDRGSDCKGKRNPLPMLRLWRRLNKLIEHYRIDCVVFEEAFAMGDAKYRLDSMQHTTILWAVSNGIDWARVVPTRWKKIMLGKGNANRHEYLQAAKLRFREHEFRFDDEAAARWLLEFALTKGGRSDQE